MVRIAILGLFTLVHLVNISHAQCPTLQVIGPPGLTLSGEPITFRAEVSSVVPKVAYKWSVDRGTITKGQGTREMTLSSEGLDGVVTATVEIDGLPTQCNRFALETAVIASRTDCRPPADEWVELEPDDVRARLDMFFVELINNPKQIGLVVIRFRTEDDSLDVNNRRMQFVVQHAKFRGFDTSRLVFGLEISDQPLTRLHRLPTEEELPCDQCLIVKGSTW